jgi:Xaa-Pro aminopeptidase
LSIAEDVVDSRSANERLRAIRGAMETLEYDALLAYKVGGEAYAYGGQGYFRYVAPQIAPLPIPPATAIVTADGPVVCAMYRGLTDFELDEEGSLEIRTCEMTDMTRLRSHEMVRIVVETLRERAPNARRVGLVLRDELPVWLVDALRAELGAVEIDDATDVLDRLLMIKDPEALTRLTAVAELADEALEVLFDRVRAGATEVAVVAGVKEHATAAGAEYADIRLATNDPVAGRARVGASSLKVIERGDHLHVGMDISLDGYWANIVRRGVLGRASSAYRDLYDVVRSTYDGVVDDLRVGNRVGDAASAATARMAEYMSSTGTVGWEAQRLGHGIGLENQERPFLIEGEDMTVAEHMTFAVHPGVLVPGVGQAAIGNLVRVGSNGPDALSRYTADLTELD